MKLKKRLILIPVAIGLALPFVSNAKVANDTTSFTNIGSIAQTRHNLRQLDSNRAMMAESRNDYGEVCVYCHTPHGANTKVDAPLWNRTINSDGYTTYNSQSLTQTVTAPGAGSVTCLSCHDGTIAIDSIINMPGSGGYNSAMETSATAVESWLNNWTNPNNTTATHRTMSECMACHNETDLFSTAIDFSAYMLGTDLTNDHPVGVTFPFGDSYYNGDNITQTTGVAFFDGDADGNPDSDEIRLYDTGDGFEVECASCHDPHGVPSGGSGTSTQFNPSFLRVSNDGSGVCLTCHNK